MKISQRTFQVLKNFSSINPTLNVTAGSVIRTVSQNKTVLAEAAVQEEFPMDFAIYDLSEMLGVVSLFDEPEFEFDSHYVQISDSASASSDYFYADKSMVTVPPTGGIELPDEPVKFLLGEKVLKGLLQAASVMGLPEVIVQGDGENIKVLATNSKNTTSHQFSYEVGKTSDHFKMVFKVENLKLIAGTYDVSISSSRIAKFILQDQSLSYWIATEGTSTYGN
jgi:hypothetical protein|tara:strand:+ start:2582 stop:3250 length:669 start_codon:yes stop_codon:yes gene_type:complete